jgi:hypothetical protein
MGLLGISGAFGVAYGDSATLEGASQHWLMLVGTRSTDAARDSDFNKWYNEIDIPDVLKVAGFRRARRGERISIAALPPQVPEGEIDQYVALYDIESPDIQRTMLDMLMASKKMEMTGRTTDLLKVVERVYFRQLGSTRAPARVPASGKHRFVFLERVECCRDGATENQLDDWYDTQHVPDMLTLPGITRITRYQIYRVLMVEPKTVPKFLTLYEFQGDSPTEFVDARYRLNASLQATGKMSDLFREQGSAVYQVIRDISAR